MMNEAAELRMVRIATKRAKPRLRILLVYILYLTIREMGAFTE
jgi:hypothetical protein